MIVWFVFGGIASGKTHYINKILTIDKDLVYLSADILMIEKNISYFEAREQMGKIIEQHITDNKSFITEGTGQHNDTYDWLVSFKKQPHVQLRVTYIDVPIDIAIKRNRNRIMSNNLQNDGFVHRIVSDEDVVKIYNNSKINSVLWKDFDCNYINYLDLMDDNKND